MPEDTKTATAPTAAADASAHQAATASTADASPAAASPLRKTVEQWQLEKGVHAWLVAFAATQNRWPQGRELTEAEFVAAIEAAHAIAFR